MASTLTAKLTRFAALTPNMGTYAVDADTVIPKGAIVTIDADQIALADGSGVRCVGIAVATANNRAALGEVNVRVQTQYGIHELICLDDDALPGDVVYAVDNVTVTTDPSSGGCVVGTFHERDPEGNAWVNVTTLVPAAMAGVKEGVVSVSPADLRLATGAAVAGFTDGSVDGIVVSEGVMHRWNMGSSSARWASFALPASLDPSKGVTVVAKCSREGSSDPTAALTVGAYFQPDDAAYDAGDNVGGDTTAVDGATKVVTEVTFAIDPADVPEGPCVLNLSLVPTAALDADDLNLHSLSVKFAHKG